MSMTQQQAQRLGRLIAASRAKKHISSRALVAKTGLSLAWLGDIEAGRYLDPAPDRLARLAGALDIEPSRIDKLTKGAMTEGMPEPRVYFRAKLALSQDESDKVMRYIERMRRAA